VRLMRAIQRCSSAFPKVSADHCEPLIRLAIVISLPARSCISREIIESSLVTLSLLLGSFVELLFDNNFDVSNISLAAIYSRTYTRKRIEKHHTNG
jgi:hypothetical protein